MKLFTFDELDKADLIIDAVYEGGTRGNAADDPIGKLLRVGNQGGFRYSGTASAINYLVLYTSGLDTDWPDIIDVEQGIFQYFGDNKSPGNEIHDTPKKGNLILKNLFDELHNFPVNYSSIPPIFIFFKFPTKNSNRSVQFKGLCVPGADRISAVDDLIAVWKTKDGQRFQNYRSFFTIIESAIISRAWIDSIDNGNKDCSIAPKAWQRWQKKGDRMPLVAPRSKQARTVSEQLPDDDAHTNMLLEIFVYFSANPFIFEKFAAFIYTLSDKNVIIDEITRNVIDGGRDAIGRYKLGIDKDPVYAEFALEAKCYNPGLNGDKANTVGVKETSRLISRIRNRQFGILVTTSA
ncbi:MAG: restriction endonuclease, partial [Fibrobacteres bacterium]|nr:restriction endonuclease [Fibrobacterota bacterium]